LLDSNLEICLQTSEGRLIDPTTNEIYHKDFNPQPEGDKKLNERLKHVEFKVEDVKEEFETF